jgi:hypothetical protein
MAKAKKIEPGAGHNSGLSDDDAAALQLHHSLAIRRLRAAADKIKAQYDEARQEVNQGFALLKGDLGIKRKEMEEMLALQDMGESEFIAAEKRRLGLMQRQGLPVGQQLDMFTTGDTVDDQALAEATGYRIGKRAGDPTPPEGINPIFHPDFMKGWHRAQEENIAPLGRAAQILEERKIAANADLADEGEDDASDRDEEELDEAEIAKRARKLKNSAGFMDRSEPLQAAE